MKYIDMHCDTISEIWYSQLRGENYSLADAPLMINLDKLEKGHSLCQNLGLFVYLEREKTFARQQNGPADPRHPEFLDPFWTVQQLVRVFHEEIAANKDRIVQVRNGADIRRAEKEGRLAALMSLEEGGMCEGSLENLQWLYDQGARMMTLTWNFENELAYPNYPPKDHEGYYHFRPVNDHGLKKRGFEFLEAMQEMGMIVDVSHLSDAGFYDVCDAVKGPFVASHSNARAVTGCGRNLTDDMIRKLAEHGGVMGLNFEPEFVDSEGEPARQTLQRIAAQARHIIDVGGIECIGLGTDFDGIGDNGELISADRLPILEDELFREHFTEDEVEHIFYKNVLRVYDEILK